MIGNRVFSIAFKIELRREEFLIYWTCWPLCRQKSATVVQGELQWEVLPHAWVLALLIIIYNDICYYYYYYYLFWLCLGPRNPGSQHFVRLAWKISFFSSIDEVDYGFLLTCKSNSSSQVLVWLNKQNQQNWIHLTVLQVLHTRAAWHRSAHVRNLKTYSEKYWGEYWYFCCNSSPHIVCRKYYEKQRNHTPFSSTLVGASQKTLWLAKRSSKRLPLALSQLGWNNWGILVLCELVFDSERAVSASEIYILRKISASKSKNRRASVCLCPSVSWAGGAEASLCELVDYSERAGVRARQR